MRQGTCGRLAAAIVALAFGAGAPTAAAITVPDGFVDEEVVPSTVAPVALEFTPDGRMLVAGKFGVLTS